ncbi:MAG: Gfo/Idh/MocA family oxidoreductase [Planctomycetota bacterium]|nr:Gfo/Idh/MocA family oxidoreductase [Planctomycetota bacterium]
MKTFTTILLFAVLITGLPLTGITEETLRVGIIGLDTSHVIAFTKEMNNKEASGYLARCRVVAAYPKGSPDIESSVKRVPMYTRQMKEMGVKIVDSIDALLSQVDAILLETNDGRPHLKQAIPCFKAGKPVFIDKPIAGSLADAAAIFAAADKYNTPTFSSSSLRYGKTSQDARNGALGKITRCQTHSPATIEKTHPDLFWYGIHGVESLFTVLGPGCISVHRTTTDNGKIEVVGRWKDGVTGIFREGQGYGGMAEGTKRNSAVGSYDGYKPLVVEIAKFFCTKKVPVSAQETLEIYAFMEAADESKRQRGAEVTLESVLAKAGVKKAR